MAYDASTKLILSIMTLRNTDIAERIRAVSAAGFYGMGWRLEDFTKKREGENPRQEDIPSLLKKYKVHALEIEFFRTWLGREQEAAYLRQEARLFALAQQMGARHINVAVFTPLSLRTITRAFADLCRRAAPHRLLVQLEFMPYTPPVDSLQRAWEVVKNANQPNGGLLIDAWHWARTPGCRDALTHIPPERITSVQLGDALANPMPDVVEESRHYRCIPGQGGLGIPAFLRTLEAHGVNAPLSVEVMSDELDALPAQRAAQIVKNATLAALQSPITRQTATSAIRHAIQAHP